MARPQPTDPARLLAGTADAWSSVDVTTVNGSSVRYRVMRDMTAPWHVHEASDELFYVVSGTVRMDTEHGARAIGAGQVFVVPAGTRHRARVEGCATMLAIDRIGADQASTTSVSVMSMPKPDRPT